MSILKVGRDISARDHWNGHAYTDSMDENPKHENIKGPYHTHRMAMVKELINECKFDMCVCVDIGCGNGYLLEYLARKGAYVIGFDMTEDMVNEAKKRLSDNGINGRVLMGGLENLKKLETGSVDFVFAINIIGYCTDDEERFYYRDVQRVLSNVV